MNSNLLISSPKALRSNALGSLAFAAITALGIGSSQAQDLYISDLYGDSIDVYSLPTGHVVGRPLFHTEGNAGGLAASGDDLIVSNYWANEINVYNINTGTVIPPDPLITTGLSLPSALLLNGNDLYVANTGNDTVTEYDILTGSEINGSPLVSTGLVKPQYLALDGNDLFVSSQNTVNEYNATTGVGGAVISGLGDARGLAVNGNTLYVVDSGAGTVTAYDATTGTALGPNPLITGLDNPRDIVFFNGDLYVSDVGTDTITEYDPTTGKEIGCHPLVANQNNPYNFIIVGSDPPSSAVPEPATWAMLLGGLLLFAYIRRARARMTQV